MATAGKIVVTSAGALQADTLKSQSTLAVDTTSTLTGTVAIGGGYGSTGITLSDAGVIQANGALTIDGASTLTGAVTSAAAIKSTSATGGVGYGTGAGGAGSQSTNKSTGVTLNKICGTVTTHAAELADATTVSFVLTNSAIAATDVVVCAPGATGATAGAYIIWANEMGAGSCTISIRNVSGGALSEAIPINFVVIKGVAS